MNLIKIIAFKKKDFTITERIYIIFIFRSGYLIIRNTSFMYPFVKK